MVVDRGTVEAAPADRVLRELERARAADLARLGDLDGAAAVLVTGVAADDPTPEDLDLLARVRAQQGRLGDASDSWRRAAALAGDEQLYSAQRRKAAELLGQQPALWRGSHGALLAAAALAAAAGALSATVIVGAGTGTSASTIADVQRSQDELGGDVADLVERERNAPVAVEPERGGSARLDAIAGRLGRLGVVVRPDAADLVVTFREGLFNGDVLTSEGDRALAEVGGALATDAGIVGLTVVGHTDDVPVTRGRYRDDAELGLARALAAAHPLASASGVPLNAIALSTSGAIRPPYPNTSAADRSRNRTVTLHVSVEGPG